MGTVMCEARGMDLTDREMLGIILLAHLGTMDPEPLEALEPELQALWVTGCKAVEKLQRCMAESGQGGELPLALWEEWQRDWRQRVDEEIPPAGPG